MVDFDRCRYCPRTRRPDYGTCEICGAAERRWRRREARAGHVVTKLWARVKYLRAERDRLREQLAEARKEAAQLRFLREQDGWELAEAGVEIGGLRRRLSGAEALLERIHKRGRLKPVRLKKEIDNFLWHHDPLGAKEGP